MASRASEKMNKSPYSSSCWASSNAARKRSLLHNKPTLNLLFCLLEPFKLSLPARRRRALSRLPGPDPGGGLSETIMMPTAGPGPAGGPGPPPARGPPASPGLGPALASWPPGPVPAGNLPVATQSHRDSGLNLGPGRPASAALPWSWSRVPAFVNNSLKLVVCGAGQSAVVTGTVTVPPLRRARSKSLRGTPHH